MTDTSLTAYFGDAEYAFRLTKATIEELERKCGPIGALCNRVFNRNFSQADINETIRLALIGSDGTTPKRANELIAAYAEGRPLIETCELAAKILERVLLGPPHEKDNANAS